MAAFDSAPLPQMRGTPPFTLPTPNVQAVDGETIPRRHPEAVDGFKATPEEGVATLYDILMRSAKKFGDADAVGSRTLVKQHVETKMIKKIVHGKEEMVPKEWTYFELSEYKWSSYNEFVKLCLQLGAGLRKFGLTKGDRVHVYAATSMHWFAMAQGASTQSMPIVTAYDTLGEEGLTHSLQATKARLMFLDAPLLKTLIKPLQDMKQLEVLVYDKEDEVVAEDLQKLKAAHPHLQIISFEKLRAAGEESPVDAVPPASEDICCIMYTSGSTGPPKGVSIKHRSIVGSVAGGGIVIHHMLGPEDS